MLTIDEINRLEQANKELKQALEEIRELINSPEYYITINSKIKTKIDEVLK